MSINPPAIDETKLFLINPNFISFVRTGSGQLRDIGTVASIFMEIAIVTLTLFGLFFSYVSIQEHNAQSALDASGVRTQARVIDRSIKKSKVTFYNLKYRYDASDNSGVTRTYEGEGSVDVDLFNATQMGAMVDIVYVGNDPIISRLMSEGATSGDLTVNLLFSGLFLVMAIIILIMVASSYYRNRQLERDGKVIIGELVECKRHISKNGHQIRAKYRFTTPSNEEKTGMQSNMRNDLGNTQLPAAGTPVAVLYATDKVYRML